MDELTMGRPGNRGRGLTRLAVQELRLLFKRGPEHYAAFSKLRLNKAGCMRRLNPAVMGEQQFFEQLDERVPALRHAREHAQSGNIVLAQETLASHFRERNSPALFFEENEVPELIRHVPAGAQMRTMARADQILKNVFVYRGQEPVRFQGDIDWGFCPGGNRDWTWDLNRHVFFETLGRAYRYSGREEYAGKFADLVRSWIRNNPPTELQENWSSPFELGLRAATWVSAYALFRRSPSIDAQTWSHFLRGILCHGHLLNATMELHCPNNHLLLEAKSLALLGLVFPEFRESKVWLRRGLRILYGQIRAQVCEDGVHGERATHYHRVIAGELLELFVLLRTNNVPIPRRILNRFERMVEFERWITKPDGRIPLLGDSALGDTHLRFDAATAGPLFLDRTDLAGSPEGPDESTCWLLGPERVRAWKGWGRAQTMDSRGFEEGGFFVMRSGNGTEGSYLVFDCGPFGYPAKPGHGHADALSFELHTQGRSFLVDPGVYSTQLEELWRNYFRGSSAHNTVVVDEKDQTRLEGKWGVVRPARAELRDWFSSIHLDVVDGSHNGYTRLKDPVQHRRQIVFVKPEGEPEYRPEYWLIVDTLTGKGSHTFDLLLHLDAGLKVERTTSGTYLLQSGEKCGLHVATFAPAAAGEVLIGETEPIQGWISYRSGEKMPAAVLRLRQVGAVPVQFVTLCAPLSLSGTPPRVRMDQVEEAGRRIPSTRAYGVTVEGDLFHDRFYYALDGRRRQRSFAGLTTNGSFLLARYAKDGTLRKVLSKGTTIIEGAPLVEAQLL